MRRKLLPLTLISAIAALIAVVTPTLVRAADAGETVVPPAPTETINPHAGEPSADIVLAGGCFWCTELAMEQVKGVTDVVSGYAGDVGANAKYSEVSYGRTKHAEVIKVTYDPSKVTLGELFQAFFLIHHPTQANGQGPDIGKQYRPAIFYADDAEKQAAESYLEQLKAGDVYPDEIATKPEPLGDGFFPAEDYHQDYVAKNPNDRYVVTYAYPKVEKLKKYLPELLKDSAKE